MINYPKIFLKKDKEEALKRKHRWVFSGAIEKMDKGIQNGDIVSVVSSSGTYLASGMYSAGGSIAVRVISFDETPIDLHYFKNLFFDLWHFKTSLFNLKETNTFRLVHGEGDGVPGLIIDYYNTHLVIQSHTLGIHKLLPIIKEALLASIPTVQTIYYKSASTLHEIKIENEFLYGNDAFAVVSENGVQFVVNWVEGQKTGFFIDQRDNRKLLQQFVRNKSVLNTFCYSGGFSMYALAAGASEVYSIDGSETALALCKKNTLLNNFSNHSILKKDVFDYLSDEYEKSYDVVILDPPAFAKNLRARDAAVKAYKRLNVLGLKKVNPKGYLLTFSCSQVMEKTLFENTIISAAIESGRKIKILKHLEQGLDHPVDIYHPESAYLKGLLLYVE